MKELFLGLCLACALIALGWFANDVYYDDEYNYDKLEVYEEYYYNAECLLDTLDKYDDWVDRFDPYGYYESISKIDSINKGLK